MSCKELIDSLRKGADERISKLWEDAEHEAGAARADIARKLGQQRGDGEKQLAAAARIAEVKALSEANNQARALRLAAEKELADQLLAAALSSLRALRTRDYEAVFGRLSRELPALAWQTVRVNPDDVALAKRIFPDAAVVGDRNITGGVDAATEDGAIRVVNTLEKRLERAWSELLPGLIRDVYEEAGHGAPAGP